MEETTALIVDLHFEAVAPGIYVARHVARLRRRSFQHVPGPTLLPQKRTERFILDRLQCERIEVVPFFGFYQRSLN